MKVKATIGFAGQISMHAGQIRNIPEGDTLDDLLHCGYVESIEPAVEPADEAAAVKKGAKSKGAD